MKLNNIQNNRVIANPKRLDSQRRMTVTVHTFVTPITIIVLFEGCTRTLVRSGQTRFGCHFTCHYHMSLHGMSTFMRAIIHDGQQDQNEDPGKDINWDMFKHISNNVRLHPNCQESIENSSGNNLQQATNAHYFA